MNLLDVIDHMAEHVPGPFIAPLPDAYQVRVLTVQEYPYWFTFRRGRGFSPGWWRLRPVSDKRAVLDGKAQPADVMDYLSSLPRFYVIAGFRVAPLTWLCTPWHAADTEQRGWPNAQPRELHLVRHAIMPFDTVVARGMGSVLLYEDVATRLEGSAEKARFLQEHLRDWSDLPVDVSDDYRRTYEVVRSHYLGLRRADEERQAEEQRRARAERRAAMMQTTEGRFRERIEFLGAEFVALREAGESYRVTWRYGGREYDMRFSRQARLQAAGYCLDNRDSAHNAASIVAIMHEHQRRGRSH